MRTVYKKYAIIYYPALKTSVSQCLVHLYRPAIPRQWLHQFHDLRSAAIKAIRLAQRQNDALEYSSRQ